MPPDQAMRTVQLAAIQAPGAPIRRNFPEAELDELAASIREKGVLQPLLVRPAGAEFELIAGARRWHAARRAGLREVPAVVREATDTEAVEIALVENLQREDLSLIAFEYGWAPPRLVRVLSDYRGVTGSTASAARFTAGLTACS